MDGEQLWQHMLNPMHDVAGTGGIYIRLEHKDKENDFQTSRTFIYRPMTTLSWATFAVTFLKNLTTLGTTPGRVFEKKPEEAIIYDDRIVFKVSRSQYEGILASLLRGTEIVQPLLKQGHNIGSIAKEGKESLSTLAYNYIFNDSTLFAVRLLQEHGLTLPETGYTAPFNYYKRIIRAEYVIPLTRPLLSGGEVQCVIPRSELHHTTYGSVTTFEEKLDTEKSERALYPNRIYRI
jgi:hypothetical protein